MKPGDLVVVLGKLDRNAKAVDKDKLVKGTYIGDLRMEGADCYVLLESGDIWTGLKREIRLLGEQE